MSSFIYATSAQYSNERRMTLAQCITIADNFAQSFGITLHVERTPSGRYELQHIKEDKTRALIQAESTTALYWSMVEMRDLFWYAQENIFTR